MPVIALKKLAIKQVELSKFEGKWKAYGFGPVQHADTKIPQAQPTVLANTAKAVVLSVALPGVKSH